MWLASEPSHSRPQTYHNSGKQFIEADAWCPAIAAALLQAFVSSRVSESIRSSDILAIFRKERRMPQPTTPVMYAVQVRRLVTDAARVRRGIRRLTAPIRECDTCLGCRCGAYACGRRPVPRLASIRTYPSQGDIGGGIYRLDSLWFKTGSFGQSRSASTTKEVA